MMALSHLKQYLTKLESSQEKNIYSQFEAILKEYVHNDETYSKVRDLLTSEMDKGLSKKYNSSANIKMLISYVQTLPKGTEVGNYLALDLGGSNFRVLLVTLNKGKVEMKNKVYPISQDLMIGAGVKLFDYIAECIAKFIKDEKLSKQHMSLGFTFSFPLKQEGLAVGRLVNWTKGFKCEGVVGQDVVKLLHEAIKRRNDLNVECVAILNDTVGCLMSCAYTDQNTRVGVIIGTGSNACYLENLDKVELWDGSMKEPKQVIINTEWGAFGDNNCLSFICTSIDKIIDDQSINKGQQIFEKMISGMYMGEIVRLIVMQCHSAGLIFSGIKIGQISTQYKFQTKFVSMVEKDDGKNDQTETNKVLKELGVEGASSDDCLKLWLICTVVSERAAYLAAAGIAALVNRVDHANVTVGVDGSLYRYHPTFSTIMQAKTQQLVKPHLKVKMILSEDGSGKGAAFVAAAATAQSNLQKS